MIDLAGSIAESRRLVVVTPDTLEPGPANTEFGMVKTGSDLARYRHVIDASRADGIVEVGTLWGTSAVWFAETAGCPVFSIDIAPQVDAGVRETAVSAGVTFWTGSSVDPATIIAVGEWMAENGVHRPMIVLDGDHNAATVAAELDLYGPLVAPGGYLVVEDGIIRWTEAALLHRGCPLDALEAWLPAHREFEVDMVVEDMFATTQFPSGWLRRREVRDA